MHQLSSINDVEACFNKKMTMMITELSDFASNNVLMSVEKQGAPERITFFRNKAQLVVS